jgi:hypothetical protein
VTPGNLKDSRSKVQRTPDASSRQTQGINIDWKIFSVRQSIPAVNVTDTETAFPESLFTQYGTVDSKQSIVLPSSEARQNVSVKFTSVLLHIAHIQIKALGNGDA